MAALEREAPSTASSRPDTPTPEVQLLSNGRYHLMLTAAGSGWSRWKGLSISRWLEDGTCDNWGSFGYVRDLGGTGCWSTGLQPTLRRPDTYAATFAETCVTFFRRDGEIETRADIAVAAEDDVEVRRILLVNGSAARRELDLTSYAEIVLAPPATDSAHPAFSKLFVETEILREQQAILCTRRAQAPGDPTPWMFHLLTSAGLEPTAVSYETDRARFIGRGRTTADPQALDHGAILSASAGPVLDPVAAIRCGFTLDPGAAATIDLISGVCDTRAACLDLVRRYQDRAVADRAFAPAPMPGQVLASQIRPNAEDARLHARLAAALIYADRSLRADSGVLGQNRQGQSGLWRYGISGDLPIALLRVAKADQIDSVRQLVEAHRYWRSHGLAADLVILREDRDGHGPALAAQIAKLIDTCGKGELLDKPGGLFVRPAESIPEADWILLQAAARLVFKADDGPLAQQIAQRRAAAPPSVSPPTGRADIAAEATPAAVPSTTATTATPATTRTAATAATPDWTAPTPQTPTPTSATPPPAEPGGSPLPDLIIANGLGGFTAAGRDYVITTRRGQATPAPWVNVLANPTFGTLVSESGSAATWSENAQEFRLTPWSNDPVGDANTEACYLRDEDSDRYWSATPLPSAGVGPYVTRHGFGYSVFEHSEGGIASELVVYVAIDAPVKFTVLKLRNDSGRVRRLCATSYVEWVLGDERAKTLMHVATERDVVTGAVYARNRYSADFAGCVAFFDVDEAADASVCCDRTGFLGRNGTLRQPAAMSSARLSGTVGAGLDPCAAFRVPFELADGQTREIVFRLGAAPNDEEARRLVQRWRGASAAQEALAAVRLQWEHTLGAVQVETPDKSLDILVNGWLVYQVLACRLWARNAFYQSSGAFGFRDQLQDVMALVHAAPQAVREHLLRSASRQFTEGDAQHWWHPPSGRGVRTRCSDDYLWLPMAACRYVAVTGDMAVLDEPVSYLEGRALEDGEASYYELPAQSGQKGNLYEHCVRAVEHGLRFGVHGLPLMGAGDWNDGMNLVGAAGKGESVWLAFFLHSVLAQFSALAERRGDASYAEHCSAEATRLGAAIEQSSWDGAWYRRAWFDDGSPLGTSANTECRIDSIAQSWAVLSGAGDAERARQAMEAVDAHLVHRDTALIQLLDPPFDHSDPSPGYIQGYVQGVRENGGQYTHAAVWAGMAFAGLGDSKRAWELFTMLAPVNHARSPEAVALYKTEPYVLASDVYALPPHTGRGGWTWYTGSAGWMVRFILESLLGLHVEADRLQIVPCIPAHWKSFKLSYRYRTTMYEIGVQQSSLADAGPVLTVDGIEMAGTCIAMVDDQRLHKVEVRLDAARGRRERNAAGAS